jgi:hypothetical protein
MSADTPDSRPPSQRDALSTWMRLREERLARSTRICVVATTCRAVARRCDTAESASRADESVTGWLVETDEGRVCHPTRATSDQSGMVDVPRTQITAATWIDAPRHPLMPPARYLRLSTRTHDRVAFLIWDPDRFPPLEPEP